MLKHGDSINKFIFVAYLRERILGEPKSLVNATLRNCAHAGYMTFVQLVPAHLMNKIRKYGCILHRRFVAKKECFVSTQAANVDCVNSTKSICLSGCVRIIVTASECGQYKVPVSKSPSIRAHRMLRGTAKNGHAIRIRLKFETRPNCTILKSRVEYYVRDDLKQSPHKKRRKQLF